MTHSMDASAQAAVTGSAGSSAAEDLVCRLHQSKYPHSKYCFFYGSTAMGAARAKSDLNVLIVSASALPPYREKFLFEGKLVDAMVYDEESLNGAMQIAKLNGQFRLTDAVISAVVLPRATPESTLLKEIASRVKQRGFAFETALFQRQFVTNILDDLVDCSVPAERNMLCVDLFKATVDLVLIRGGAGMSAGKVAAHQFSAMDADLHVTLDAALAAALGGEVAPLVALSTAELDKIGGVIRDGFRLDCPPSPRMPLPLM